MKVTQLNPGTRLALVQLPGRMRRALRLFREITGHTAVTSLATTLPERGTTRAISPPVHPQCAERLRSVRKPPCGEQWMLHIRSARGSPRVHTHTCPIGMRCSCVPIHLGGELVGVAKLVAGSRTSEAAFSAALGVLRLAVAETCQESVVSSLSEEVRALRQCVTDLRLIHAKSGRDTDSTVLPAASPGDESAAARNSALVERAIAHLERHYQEPSLSLPVVAKALGCNPRYLTSRFSQVVGERMHAYLVGLRLSHACGLLITTDLSIKEVAFASGFAGAGWLASAFRRHVGVSPGEYRRVFTRP